MRRIAEYPCVLGEQFDLEIYPCTLLCIKPGPTSIVLAADVDDSGVATTRTFVFVKTGDAVPANGEYIDTIRFVDPDPPNFPILFHLFELV